MDDSQIPEETVEHNRYTVLLSSKGFLTVNQFVQYMKDWHPKKSISFPTVLRFFDKGYLSYEKVGGQYRIGADSIRYYIAFGTEGKGGAHAPFEPIPDVPIVHAEGPISFDNQLQSYNSDDPSDVEERLEDAKKAKNNSKLGLE